MVSKASAGALEAMEVHSTSNMMRFLDGCKEQGWHVAGAALDASAVGVTEMPRDKPTILVLGNEGAGIRRNVLNRCDVLVRINGKEGNEDGLVDSLNVSVSGGILLHHMLAARNQ